ncbi:MAG: hypothetical protein J7K20_07430 [Thermodesulfobacterium sp.]|nr:hypothetical protein [Thermodesulfobacterium sp.]
MSKIEIFNTTKVYVACPARVATGGPELLHQFATQMRKVFGVPTFMLYYPKMKNPVHPEYFSYRIPYVYVAEDVASNILIVPEIESALSLMAKYRNIRKGVWFLSVDNYYLSKLSRKDFFIKRAVNKIAKLILGRPVFEIRYEDVVDKYPIKQDQKLKLADFCLCNTYRGCSHLQENGLYPVFYLSEYLHEDYLRTSVDLSKKENFVAFNPAKGFLFTRKIIKAADDITFVPIENLTRDEVIQLLKKAKVYIDFGNHPGKDRLPREAAILGCCVITGKRGSAKYFEDVPIPEEYKFEDKEENIPLIVEKIKDCFKNFEMHYRNFENYRKIIKNEPEKFIKDLKNIFKTERG